MPELDLKAEDFTAKGRNPLVLDRIWAAMVWPNDALWRDRAVETSGIAAGIDAVDWVSSGPIIGAVSLLPAPRQREIDFEFLQRAAAAVPIKLIQDEARVRIANGQRIGAMLCEFLGITRSRKAPWRKMSQMRAHYAKLLPPGVKAKSKQSFHAVWKDFQPVAHLWAAHFTFMFAYKRAGIEPCPVPCLLGDLERFLGWAEACRIIGEATKFESSRATLIVAKDAWRAPEGLPVPVEEFTAHLQGIRDGSRPWVPASV